MSDWSISELKKRGIKYRQPFNAPTVEQVADAVERQLAPKPPKRSKYNAKRTIVDGINFMSKAESEYYKSLKLLQSQGIIKYFLMQVPIHLPGGVKYVCDFQEHWANGEVRYSDKKGFKTPIYLLKKKQVEAIYPIKIQEV